MTEQEKKILENLNRATDDVTVPERLQPDNIQKMLEEAQEKKTSKRARNAGDAQKFVSPKWFRYAAGAAAAFVLVAGLGIVVGTSVTKKGGGTASSGEEKLVVADSIAAAKDYDEVYGYIKSYQDEISQSYDTGGTFFDIGAKSGTASRESAADSASGANMSSAKSVNGAVVQEAGAAYSDTNVRTEGIGEADVVKTDGKYLYALTESATEIAILDAVSDEMQKFSTIEAIDGMQISEFYVDGTKLFVLGNLAKVSYDEDRNEFYHGEDTALLTYNISDIENPHLTDKVTQSGRYRSSRFTDGYLYLFSDFCVYDSCKKSERDLYLPMVNEKIIPESDIFLPPVHAANQYLVVSSVKAEAPGETVEQKAVLAENGECYVSGENIYIYENTRSSVLARTTLGSVNQTVIRRISYKDGRLAGEAQGKVNGSLNDSFSIDEYEGNLRVVTTIDGAVATTNAVYVLDEELTVIGKIEDLAEKERVYSVRFFGDTGYFVTFRQTDPLFSVDLSDPKNPKIIGTLKIPGFSEYLHFYGENLLLGIGMDADDNGVTSGVKISMFDISDPADVKEVHKYTLKETYHSDIFNDYRAVLVDAERNMIGFSAYGTNEYYYIFSYDETNGFRVEMEEEVNGNSYMGTRGVYVGDKLFVIKGNAVESYRIGSYEKVDDILL